MTIDTSHTIKINKKEAQTIQKVLHLAYMDVKREDDEATRRLKGINELKALRDCFSEITGVRYMGLDA